MIGPIVIGLVVIGLFVIAPVQLGAQNQSQEWVPRAATDIQSESLPALPLLYAAYAFVFVALAGYVFLLWRRLAKVESEIADVRGRIAQRR